MYIWAISFKFWPGSLLTTSAIIIFLFFQREHTTSHVSHRHHVTLADTQRLTERHTPWHSLTRSHWYCPCQYVNSRGFQTSQDKLSWRQDTRQLITFGYSSFGIFVCAEMSCSNTKWGKAPSSIKKAGGKKHNNSRSSCRSFKTNSCFYENWLAGNRMYCERPLEAQRQPVN